MPVPNPVRLSELTTLRLGGPAPDLVTVRTAEEIAEVVGTADRSGHGVLVLGLGLILLGVVVMLIMRARQPAFFRGETLNRGTPSLIIPE